MSGSPLQCALAAALVAIASGCSDVKSRQWSSTAGVASTASGTAFPAASASIPTEIVIQDPAPGAWLATQDVTVKGRAVLRSGAPVVSVDVGGVAAALQPDGSFQARVKLDLGLTTLSVHARDAFGTDHATHASYAVGPTKPYSEPVHDALHARLNGRAIALVERLLDGELTKVDFDKLLKSKNPVLAQSLVGGLIAVQIDVLQVTHGKIVARMKPTPGVLALEAEMPAIKLLVRAQSKPGSTINIGADLEITARIGTAKATGTIDVLPGGGLATKLSPATVDLLDVKVASPSAIAQLAANLVKSKIESLLEDELKKLIANHVPRVLDKELGKLLAPKTITARGKTVTITPIGEKVSIDPLGVFLALGADIASPQSSATTGGPGWLFHASTPPALTGPKAAYVNVDPDLANKAFAVAWRAGLLDLEVDSTSAATLGLATLPKLDVAGIGPLFPELKPLVPGSTPVVLRLKPKLPPVLEVGPGATPFRLALGQLELELLVQPNGGPPRSFATIAVHAKVPVEPKANGATISFGTGPQRLRYLVSVTDQPVVAIDETALQTRVTLLLDAMIPGLVAKIPTITVPSIQGSTVQNLAIGPDGQNLDRITASGDL